MRKTQARCIAWARKTVAAIASQVAADRSTPSGRNGLELSDLDGGREPSRLPGLEAAGADLQSRRGARGDGALQRVLELLAGEARGQEPGEQHVARADGRDRLDPRGAGTQALHLALLAEEREAP